MISIKKVDAEAIPVIRRLAHAIWPVTYKGIISDEQIVYMLDWMYSVDSLQQQILKKGHQFIMAYEADIPVGYLSYSINDKTEPTIYRLHKLYVSTDHQRKGIAGNLLEYMIAEIKPLGATEIILNVNRHNAAVQFYKTKGFTVKQEEMLDIGGGFFMDDYIMQKII